MLRLAVGAKRGGAEGLGRVGPAAPEEITTSARILQFPPIPDLPRPLRGRNLVADRRRLHAAAPRSAEEELRALPRPGPGARHGGGRCRPPGWSPASTATPSSRRRRSATTCMIERAAPRGGRGLRRRLRPGVGIAAHLRRAAPPRRGDRAARRRRRARSGRSPIRSACSRSGWRWTPTAPRRSRSTARRCARRWRRGRAGGSTTTSPRGPASGGDYYEADAHQRLLGVRSKVDPDGMFHANHGVVTEPDTLAGVPVSWSDQDDAILGGDLTAALAYVHPRGGAVVTAVAPIGLRDRERGHRHASRPRSASARSSSGSAEPARRARLPRARARLRRPEPASCSCRARRATTPHPIVACSNDVVRAGLGALHGAAAARSLLGPLAERVLRRPRAGHGARSSGSSAGRTPRCAGKPEVSGAPLPERDPPAQAPPKNGTGPRVDVERAAKRLRVAAPRAARFPGADGFPLVRPVEVGEASERGHRPAGRGGCRRRAARRPPRAPLQRQARRPADPPAHRLARVDDGAIYAPHTEGGFRAPANKTLLLLANGLMAKRGLKQGEGRQGRGPLTWDLSGAYMALQRSHPARGHQSANSAGRFSRNAPTASGGALPWMAMICWRSSYSIAACSEGISSAAPHALLGQPDAPRRQRGDLLGRLAARARAARLVVDDSATRPMRAASSASHAAAGQHQLVRARGADQPRQQPAHAHVAVGDADVDEGGAEDGAPARRSGCRSRARARARSRPPAR